MHSTSCYRISFRFGHFFHYITKMQMTIWATKTFLFSIFRKLMKLHLHLSWNPYTYTYIESKRPTVHNSYNRLRKREREIHLTKTKWTLYSVFEKYLLFGKRNFWFHFAALLQKLVKLWNRVSSSPENVHFYALIAIDQHWNSFAELCSKSTKYKEFATNLPTKKIVQHTNTENSWKMLAWFSLALSMLEFIITQAQSIGKSKLHDKWLEFCESTQSFFFPLNPRSIRNSETSLIFEGILPSLFSKNHFYGRHTLIWFWTEIQGRIFNYKMRSVDFNGIAIYFIVVSKWRFADSNLEQWMN